MPPSPRTNTHSFQAALRCLLHPAGLLSIALLLLNDHLLKALVPSWATGKLSDFAGLFFFPFLLAAVLGLAAALWRRLTLQFVGRVAFAITALWLVAAKATVLGNAMTAQAVSALLGHPVSIALDPTDLAALAVLWPAWRLWGREAARVERGEAPSRVGYVVLMAAALASIATTPAPEELAVRFVVAGNEMYVLTKSGHEPAQRLLDSGEWKVYRTPDNGRTWSEVDPIPEAFKDLLARPFTEEVIVSDPKNPRIQYRVRREDKVEYSEDGGATWQAIWEVPAGRREFLDVYASGPLFSRPVVIGPYDLAYAPDASGNLFVAAGTMGVLVLDRSGVWSSSGVGWARPLPFSTRNPIQIPFLLFPIEILVLVYFVPLATLAVSIAGWLPILRAVARLQGIRKAAWMARPAVLLLGVLPVPVSAAAVLLLAGQRDIFAIVFGILFYPILALFVWGLVMTWINVVGEAVSRVQAEHSRVTWIVTTVLLVPATAVPFALWVMDVITFYSTAQTIAGLLGLAVVAGGGFQVYRLSRAAAGEGQARSEGGAPCAAA